MAETMQTPSMSSSTGAPAAQRGVDEAKDLGNELIAALRDNAVGLLDEQRNRAASEIAAAGALLRRSAQSLDDGNGVAARCANQAAAQIDDFADWLRTSSWSEMASGIERFARRNPMVFVGAAAALGFIAYRFVGAAPSGGFESSTRSTPTSAGGADSRQAQMVSSAIASGEVH